MQFLTTALLGQPRHAEKVADDFLVFRREERERERGEGRSKRCVSTHFPPSISLLMRHCWMIYIDKYMYLRIPLYFAQNFFFEECGIKKGERSEY